MTLYDTQDNNSVELACSSLAGRHGAPDYGAPIDTVASRIMAQISVSAGFFAKDRSPVPRAHAFVPRGAAA